MIAQSRFVRRSAIAVSLLMADADDRHHATWHGHEVDSGRQVPAARVASHGLRFFILHPRRTHDRIARGRCTGTARKAHRVATFHVWLSPQPLQRWLWVRAL